MASSTTKKVYVRRFDRQLIAGYVTPQTYLRSDGAEVLDRSAQAILVPYEEIKAVYFVRDFQGEPDANQKKVFAARPKLDGLWIRMQFRDGEILEGIIPNNLLLMTEYGVNLTPPDANANTQKIFVPRLALQQLTVMGVIGSPVHRRRSKRREPVKEQMDLFEETMNRGRSSVEPSGG